jgi:hypothetical protein
LCVWVGVGVCVQKFSKVSPKKKKNSGLMVFIEGLKPYTVAFQKTLELLVKVRFSSISSIGFPGIRSALGHLLLLQRLLCCLCVHPALWAEPLDQVQSRAFLLRVKKET